MKYKIFFDESNKLDKTKKYSYYGAYGVEQTKCERVKRDLNQILELTGKKGELHFTEYNNDKDIAPYLYFLHHFLRTDFQINLFVVNNDVAYSYAKHADITIKELRELFYVKIPERLFYGLTRELSSDFKEVEIVVDHSPEYGKMKLYSKLKQQMNSHAIYRGMKYYVKKAWHKESHKSIPLQVIDLIIGIIVFIMEKSYINTFEDKPVIKSDLIYRFLLEEDNIYRFQNQINIYKWDGEKESIKDINISEYLSQFVLHKSRFDIGEMSRLLNLMKRYDTSKDLRIKMGYSNNKLRMLLGYKDQLIGQGRNSFIMKKYKQHYKD